MKEPMKKYRNKETGEKVDKHGNSELMLAIKRHDIDDVRKLIKSKCNINYQRCEGHSALSFSCTEYLNQNEYSDQTKQICLDIIHLLIESGADLNTLAFGRSSLNSAKYYVERYPYMEKVIKILEKSGAKDIHSVMSKLEEQIKELEEMESIPQKDIDKESGAFGVELWAKQQVAKKALDIINQLKEQLSKEIKAHADCKNWKKHLEEENIKLKEQNDNQTQLIKTLRNND